MNWPTSCLGDLVEIKGGGTPSRANSDYWGGEIPWATVKDFKGGVILGTEEHITCSGLENSATNLISMGTILIPSRMALGKVAIAGVDMAINQDLKALAILCPEKLDRDYLFWFLSSVSADFERAGKGATVKGITLDFVRAVQVPLPPLPIQCHIAKVLEQADSLRQQAQQMEAELDRLAQALFLEMFGDPVGNPKGWPIVRLGQHLEAIESGWSPTCSEQQAAPGEWGVLKLGAVTSCTYRESENKKLPGELSPRLKLEVKAGDLLFSRKNTYALVAASAYVRNTQGKIMLSDLIFRLVPGKMLSPIYLWGLLVNPSVRSEVQNLAGGAAGSMPNISKAKLGDKEIPLPPIETQEQYAEAVQSLWEQLDLHRQRAAQLDCLFNSLMQRAFQGELTPKLA